MINFIVTINYKLSRHLGKLLLLGSLVQVLRNWQAWKRDKTLLEQLCSKPKSRRQLSSAPKVSILVAAWNEAETFHSCLSSLIALTYPDLEIIVCAGGTDNTLEIAKNYLTCGVTVFEQPSGLGKQGALARCFTASRGEIIFLTDADCIINQDSFEAILAPIINDKEVATSGARRPLVEQLAQPFVQYQFSAIAYNQANNPEYTNGIYGANAALIRAAIVATNSFQTKAPTGTDYVLGQQLRACGYKIRYVPDSVIQTRFEQVCFPYLIQQRRWLLNLLALGYRFRRPEHYIPAVRAIFFGNFMVLAPVGFLLFLLMHKKQLAINLLWLEIAFQVASLGAKLRYNTFLRLYLADSSIDIDAKILRKILYQNLDFLIWFLSGWHLLFKRGRWRW